MSLKPRSSLEAASNHRHGHGCDTLADVLTSFQCFRISAGYQLPDQFIGFPQQRVEGFTSPFPLRGHSRHCERSHTLPTADKHTLQIILITHKHENKAAFEATEAMNKRSQSTLPSSSQWSPRRCWLCG